ncbi:MAG: hypothetical protein K0R29_112 [Pseudobdellovibrio sp.]|nr:hypothetical protein [Pseudobdellovibrio sp.]
MNLNSNDQQNLSVKAEKIFSDSRSVFFILSALALVVFWPALFGDFVGDDVLRVIEYENLLAGNLWDLLFYYTVDRPVVMLTIWLNYKMAGLQPFIYKLTNLLFHLLCAFTGFQLLQKLLKNISLKSTISFFAAAIFLVHPLNHHVVQSAVQRSVSLAGIFLLLSFIYFIKFYESRARSVFLFSLFLYLLAVLSKPVSVALPAVLLIYLLTVNARWTDIVKWVSPYLLFLVIPAWNYSGTALASADTVTEFKFENWRYFLIQTKVFFIYLYKYFYPFPMEFIHSIHNSADKIYSENFIPYLTVYVAIFVVLGVWFLRKRTLAASLLLMAYAVYLPQSSFYSILHVLFYHRVYLSVFFATAAICYFLINRHFFKTRIKVTFSLLSVGIVYFSVSTFTYFSQVKDYSDWLWYNVKANPGNLNYNVSTLFMLKRRGYPVELINKFADFLSEKNPEKEVLNARSIALYSAENAEARKVVLDTANYLSAEQTSNSFFHGAMLFLESEAGKFFQKDQAILSLNSLYFSRLNTTVFINDTALKSFARNNFENVLEIQTPPAGVSEEKLKFLKLRSRIVLFLYFKVDTGLNLQDALSELQTKYSQLPESKWLIERLSK